MSPDGRSRLRARRRRYAAAVAFSRPAVGPLGWGWIISVLFLLFYPFAYGGDVSIWKEMLPYGLHAVMWMGLVWSLWPLARGRRGAQWMLLALLVLAGGLSEVLQGCFRRTPEWIDWGMDTLGAVLGFLWGVGCKKTAWGLAGAFWAGLLACIMVPMAQEWQDFPLMADGASQWSRYRWERNGVRVRFPANCIRAVCDKAQPAEYPGMFRSPVCHDWTGSRGLELEIYWPWRNDGSGILGVRIDDRSGNPPYDDRWQTEVEVTNGWNSLVLTHSWLQTPGGRQMDSRNIHTWGVFVISAPKTNWFSLRKARLLVGAP